MAVARRRWLWIVVGVIIGLLTAIGYYQITPRSYEATATVTITPITDDLFSNTPVDQLVNTATEAEVVRSIRIAQAAATDNDLPGDPRDLLRQLTVTVPPSSLALDMSFVAESPELAASGANGFANAYLDFRRQTAESRRADYVEKLRTRLDALTTELQDLEADARQRNILAQEIIAVREQLGTATSLPISPGQLVTEALPPRYPSSPNRLGVFAGGLVVGLIIGVALALLRHRRDDRIFTAADASALTGLPVIGRLPALDRRPELSRREADDLALTTMRLTSTAFGQGMKSWVVIRADLGMPTRAEAIAWRLGRGHDVSLVSLSDNDNLGSTRDRFLKMLPPSPGLRTVARPMRANDGYVILDGTGLYGLAEAIGIQGVDAVLVTVELGVTRRSDVRRTLGEIRDIAPDRLAPGIVVIKRGSRFRRIFNRSDTSRTDETPVHAAQPMHRPQRRPTMSAAAEKSSKASR